VVVVVCEIICEKLTAPKTQGSVLRTRSCDLSALLALALVGSCSWSCLLVVQAKTKDKAFCSFLPYLSDTDADQLPSIYLSQACGGSCQILLLPDLALASLSCSLPASFLSFSFPFASSLPPWYCTTIFISHQLRKN
jgi:hypothetical protein